VAAVVQAVAAIVQVVAVAAIVQVVAVAAVAMVAVAAVAMVVAAAAVVMVVAAAAVVMVAAAADTNGITPAAQKNLQQRRGSIEINFQISDLWITWTVFVLVSNELFLIMMFRASDRGRILRN
jgi:hypothetical protein